MKSLPAELFDAVISNLSPLEDEPTLKSCSLVCRSWVEPAQTYLFRTVELSWQIYHSVRRLFRILRESPHLSFYIHNLYIDFDKALVRDKSFQALLRFLPAVSLLTVHGYHDWNDLPHSFILSLVRLISKPALKTLCISGITLTLTLTRPSGDELVETLRFCANSLQTLILSDIDCADKWAENYDYDHRFDRAEEEFEDDDEDTPASTDPVELTKLRELVVRGNLPEFGDAIKMPNLQFLHEELASDVYDSERDVLHSCVPKTLKNLVLEFYDESTDVAPNLEEYSELQRILFVCKAQSELDSCIQMLRHVPSCNFRHLEYILLGLRTRDNVTPVPWAYDHAFKNSSWDQLAACIVPLLSLGRFKMLLIMFSYGAYVRSGGPSRECDRIRGHMLKDIVPDLRARLHDLDSKGALELRLWDSGVAEYMDDKYTSLDFLHRLMKVGYRL